MDRLTVAALAIAIVSVIGAIIIAGWVATRKPPDD
jgi:hypothetical protein